MVYIIYYIRNLLNQKYHLIQKHQKERYIMIFHIQEVCHNLKNDIYNIKYIYI